MTTSIGRINAFSYGSMAGASGINKLYVPVSKNALLYANFEHVQGVAAKSGQLGVSINKISILNSIIERVSAIRNEPVKTFTQISEERAQALIEQYSKQLHQAMKTPYALNGAMPLPGELFSFQI